MHGFEEFTELPLESIPSEGIDALEFISDYIDGISDELLPINRKIHDNPELGFEEFIAHETLTTFLESRPGWNVTRGAYGLKTAFVAKYDSQRPGPAVSFNAEYDSLPQIGHACGHNLIATASLSAALATVAAVEKYTLGGKVFLFGTPAEEGGGGKIKLLEAGAYKDNKIDVSLMSHPGNTGDASLVTTLAYSRMKVEFHGKEAHAAAAPWEGINALDALIIGYSALSVLRQQTMPGDIIQGHITHGGLAPNIIHEYAAGVFIVRSRSKARVELLRKQVQACFAGGATATGATLVLTDESAYLNHVPNTSLGRSYRHYFNRLTNPQGNGSETQIPPPAIDMISGASGASTDQGDISWAMPSLHSGFRVHCNEGGPHTPAFAVAAGTDLAHLVAGRAGKALAATAVDVLSRKGFLKEVKEVWRKDIGL